MNRKIKSIGNQKINLAIGIVGFVFVIFGTFLPITLLQKTIFLIGVALLDISAILERNTFFAILQTIALIGSIIAFAPISIIYKASIPLLLGLLSLIYFSFTGEIKNWIMDIGLIGLLGLAIGLAISMPLAYFIGGVFITFYSYLSFKQGIKIALLFLLLNTLFSVTSAIETYHYFFQ